MTRLIAASEMWQVEMRTCAGTVEPSLAGCQLICVCGRKVLRRAYRKHRNMCGLCAIRKSLKERC